VVFFYVAFLREILNVCFCFAARTAAAMMETTERAVKAALHRARTALKQLMDEEEQDNLV
jgi:DNA-directed RNA polymerase specialized sigma24 family protein